MNIQTLISHLQRSFTSYEIVGDDERIIRCEREHEGTARGIYFFSTAPLPDHEELAKIQHEILAPSYFQAKGPSRWSQYLIFISSRDNSENPDFLIDKRRIECDKSYARKIVLLDEELTDFIDKSITFPKASMSANSVVSAWEEKLRYAKLDAILTDESRAPIIRGIRHGNLPNRAEPIKSIKKEAPAKFLTQLEVKKFGGRALKGKYAFSTVNLIRGPNGSGKTSLLEAIEHYFCGATYRSGGAQEDLSATGYFGDQVAHNYQSLKASVYQARDQRWYGRNSGGRNKLYEGFARFNFLNADAASELSGKKDLKDIKTTLSKIALGPDSSYAWNRINEFHAQIEQEFPSLNREISKLANDLSESRARLSALEVPSPLTDAHDEALNDKLKEISWPMPGNFMLSNIESLADVMSLKSFLDAYTRVGAGSSAQIEEQLCALREAAESIKAADIKTTELRSEILDLNLLLRENKTLLPHLDRLSIYLDTEFDKAIFDLAGCESREAELLRKVSGNQSQIVLSSVLSEREWMNESYRLVPSLLERAKQDVDINLQEQLAKQAEIEQTATKIDSLTSRLRALGSEYAEVAQNGTCCPLCSTQMSMESLLSRISEAATAIAQTNEYESLIKSISEQQQASRSLGEALISAHQLIAHYSDDRNQPILKLIELANLDKLLLQSAASEKNLLTEKVRALEKTGLNLLEFLTIKNTALPSPENETDDPHKIRALFAKARLENSEEAQQLRQALEELREDLDSRTDLMSAMCRRYGAEDVATASEVLSRGISESLALLDAFNSLPEPVRHKYGEAFNDLAPHARALMNLIEVASEQIRSERSRSAERGIIQAQIASNEAKLGELRSEHSRLEDAFSVLSDLKLNHSLEAALSKFLEEHLSSIQKVFTKIHSPHELTLSNLTDCKMERFGDQNPVDLTQISSGQRAAVMLSIFVSLNLSMPSGPPYMLIDDPVAHIDDLNALSFLDYLADLAESGRRQIFFATANEKLANLFEKKMEFLGTSFIVHDMSDAQEKRASRSPHAH